MELLCATNPWMSRWKKIHFAKMQETTRKDVKQCLILSVVIKMGYHKNLCNQWDWTTIFNIVLGSIIMHNVIIEDELRTPIWKSLHVTLPMSNCGKAWHFMVIMSKAKSNLRMSNTYKVQRGYHEPNPSPWVIVYWVFILGYFLKHQKFALNMSLSKKFKSIYKSFYY
jgi:hypothetical protein